jgi:hypothetical protein
MTTRGDSTPLATGGIRPLRLASIKLGNDGRTDFKHAILDDVSGKKAEFDGVDFSYCVFTRAYFHEAKFRNCKFIGARFTECNFRNADIVGCDFRYADFTGTRIDTKEVLNNLPAEPNIRKELLQILRKNALSMGDVRSGREFVLREIAAEKEHLRRAWRRDEQYYKDKYSGFKKRTKVLVDRTLLWVDGFLWGHGEQLWKMLISVPSLLIICAVISTFKFELDVIDPTISSAWNIFLGELSYYFNLFLDVQIEHQMQRIIWLDWIVVLSRYLVFGVLIAGLFRWFSHR